MRTRSGKIYGTETKIVNVDCSETETPVKNENFIYNLQKMMEINKELSGKAKIHNIIMIYNYIYDNISNVFRSEKLRKVIIDKSIEFMKEIDSIDYVNDEDRLEFKKTIFKVFMRL